MTKTFIRKSLSCAIIAALVFSIGYGQRDTSVVNSYEDLSLKELLDVKIVSVSKKTESLFAAPLSASVIGREEIRQAGCTSIMEALRLVPGMIVREQGNGNYDIHLRGMDNVPPNAPFDVTSNTTTLVMIDSRPIYSYLRGGTFWETLPADINDVERIEVVRGPAAALYGPNAVNGVINIITRQTEKQGLYLVANARQGSFSTQINNASVGYQSGKWSMIASGNYQRRERTQTSYFEYYRNDWLNDPEYFVSFNRDTIANIKQLYPNPELAMQKYGGNTFLKYSPSEKIQFNLSAGAQHSIVQKVSTENDMTPFSTASSDTRYLDFRALVKGFSAQFSYNKGTQRTEYKPGNKYDFTTTDLSIEYNYKKGNFSLKPGFSYRSAVYDDTRYSDTLHKAGIFNNRGEITTRSASLVSEYTMLNNKLRLVAGISGSRFNYPDETYLSHEFASTYAIKKDHLVRAVYSRAPRSSNIFDTYVNQTVVDFPSGPNHFTRVALQGNKSLKLLTAKMFELGYRGHIIRGLTTDVELFNIRAKNYNTLVISRPYTEMSGSDTIKIRPLISTNLPLELLQNGITVSLTWSSVKWTVKPFVTLQKTNIKNYAPFSNTADAGMGPGNIYSGIGTKTILKSTPAAFGGASVNYLLTPKMNINVDAYYYGAQTYAHLSNLIFRDGIRGIDHIPAKLIVNMHISYEVAKGLRMSISGKNILNDNSREFFRTDEVPFMLLGGINYEL